MEAMAERESGAPLVIDGQGVAVLLPGVQIPPPAVAGRSYLERLAAAGVSALNVTLGIGGIAAGSDDLRALLGTIGAHFCYFEMEAARLLHVTAVADLERARREGKIGVIFGVQGLASKIEGDLSLLRILHKLGLRVAQLTGNERNALGCGCLETPDCGLSQLGRACVREMNMLGIAVDLAHAGGRTLEEAVEVSHAPVIVSHANPRGMCDNPRNVSDAGLKALASRGGVIGLTAFTPFYAWKGGRRPGLGDLVDHIAYACDLVGSDHVGIGTDFFEAESPIRFEYFHRRRSPEVFGENRLETAYLEGFDRVECFPRLIEVMQARGFREGEIRKVLGENFRRVFAEAWRGAAPA